MLQFRKDPRVFVAGQLSGVEGYMESTAIGLLAGINAYRFLQGKDPVIPPRTTTIGSLVHYITQPSGATFQPMNINFGLFPPLSNRVRGRKRRQLLGSRALSEMTAWIEKQDP
jgi:methylenetetrahydrofolate--tRNA-(uracil-5-)-methyltransferase